MLSAFLSPFALHLAFPPAVVEALPLLRRGSVSLPFLDGDEIDDVIDELSAGGGGGGGGGGRAREGGRAGVAEDAVAGAIGGNSSSIEVDRLARVMFSGATGMIGASGSSGGSGLTTNSLLALDEIDGGVRSIRRAGGASISSSSDSGSSSFAFFCSARICLRHIMAYRPPLARSSSWVPDSRTRPSWRHRIWFAWVIVERR